LPIHPKDFNFSDYDASEISSIEADFVAYEKNMEFCADDYRIISGKTN